MCQLCTKCPDVNLTSATPCEIAVILLKTHFAPSNNNLFPSITLLTPSLLSNITFAITCNLRVQNSQFAS